MSKLCTLLLTCTILSATAGTSYSQKVKVNLNLKNVALSEVINSIKQQTEFEFAYDSDLESLILNKVTINARDENINTILETVLKGTDVNYRIIDRIILLSRNTVKTTSGITKNGLVQQQKLTGTITDVTTGEPIIGANIIIEGTSVGTITDENGKFTIEITKPNSVLVISFLGYNTERIPINGQYSMDVKLIADIKKLEEVIVVGYGTQQKKDLTGSIVSVDSKELHSLPVASVGDALQGRASGVQIIAQGQPGTDPTILIRGSSSINSTSPLLVIDGVPTMSGLNQLNPDDIESMQILKDASACAIYGSRGANGVVIITTKGGKKETSQLSVNYYSGIQQATNMIKMLNASQYAAYSNEMLANGGRPTNPAWADPSTLGKGSDWLGELFKTTLMNNISVGYSGGGEKINYYISGNVLTQDGIAIHTGFKRYTIQINTDCKPFSKFKLGNHLTLESDYKYSGDFNIKNTMGALPTQTIRNADGTYTNEGSNPEWFGGIDNPIGLASINTNETTGYNMIGSIYGELEIVNGLKFKSNLGLQANLWDSRNWKPAYNWVEAPQTLSSLSQQFNKSLTWLFDNTLTYDKIFANVHHLTLLAGTSAQENRFDYISAFRQGYVTDATPVLSAGGQTGKDNSGGGSEWALFSYFGRVNYTFNDKYLVTATIRRDGSSRFGPSNRFGTFPSLSVAWRISKEDFFKAGSIISDLKLRAGYGETGNQEIFSNYPFASSLNLGNYNFNGTYVQTAFPLQMPNYQIHWEDVKQTNVGFDASLWDDRITITADGFFKNTTDMLVRGPVNVTTGYDNQTESNRPYVNAGKMGNRGIELTITSHNLTGNLKWNTNLNFTFIQNKIISLNDTVPITAGSIDGNINRSAARQQNGHPYNAFFGYVMDGIFQNSAEVNNSALQIAGATQAGDIRFKDLNHDGVINEKDRTFLGNPNPKFVFALNNNFTWNGFDMAIFLQGVYGNDIFNANRLQIEGMDAARNQSTAVLGWWHGEGTSNAMPRAVFGDPAQNNRISNRYIENGSYLRIKNVTLGYTINSALLHKAHISSLRIYSSLQNLHTFTNYSGIDPEVGISGIDNNVYPVTRTYSFGMNLIF